MALIYIFFRIITSEEDEEEGPTESRAREGPEEDSKLPTAEKAAGWRKIPPEALKKLGLKPPTETPESLRQLPALSFLSRLVRLEGDESAGTTPTAQESRSQAKLPSGADVGNAVARESGEKPERDQVSDLSALEYQLLRHRRNSQSCLGRRYHLNGAGCCCDIGSCFVSPGSQRASAHRSSGFSEVAATCWPANGQSFCRGAAAGAPSPTI